MIGPATLVVENVYTYQRTWSSILLYANYLQEDALQQDRVCIDCISSVAICTFRRGFTKIKIV